MGNGFVDWFSRSYKGIIVGLLAVMSATMVVLAMQHVNSSRPAAGATPRPAPTYSRGDQRPVAAFLGDSYTAGTGASAPSKRWTSLVAQAEGWREVNVGAGGTGYVTTAGVEGCGLEFCDNYPGRVKNVVEADPNIVVIAGGQNDFASYVSDPDRVKANIAKVFDEIHAKLPNARIIAIGPSTTSAIGPQATGLDEDVRSASEHAGATYISLLEPNVIEKAWVTSDGGHVDDDGHAAIAARVEAGL